MKRKHKASGIIIETSVVYHEDIKKYNSGVILTNPDGMKTTRMTLDPVMYSKENEAVDASFEMGERILRNHISGKEKLFFDQE